MLHLNLIRVRSPEEMARAAADMFEDLIRAKPACVLGLATGSTPLPLYRELIAREQGGKIDFSRVRSANLDEYKGLAPNQPQSYRRFMRENLFNHINIPADRSFLPDGTQTDSTLECARYDRIIEEHNGIDLQLLGIGHDGHIGFNEPGEAFELETHCVDLTPETIEANKRFFDGNVDLVPKQAYTMGIKTIMQARKVLMVANGKGKAEIVKKAFFGPVTPEVPASILQMHPDFTLVGDEEALSLI